MGPFVEKPLSSITLDDLKRLIDDAVGESLHLEYKRELHLGEKDEKKEFLRDLAAFANAEGGVIIYGMDGERDPGGKPTGIPKALAGFAVHNCDELTLTIDNLIKDGIDERLPSYELNILRVNAGNHVVLIRVPPSVRAPHMVTLGGERRFFMRSNGGRQEMSTAQIRDAVVRTETLVERILAFARQRIVQCRARGIKGPLWMMHVVPLNRNPSALDVTDQTTIQRLAAMGSAQGGSICHCIEGFKTHCRMSDRCYSHVVTFRDGTIEFLDQYVLAHRPERPFFAYAAFDDRIFRFFESGLVLYREGRLQLPAAVCVTLNGVKGCVLLTEPSTIRIIPPLEDDEILVDPIVVSRIPQDVRTVLRPVLDIIWNAFGFPRCPAFSETGEYIGYRA